MTTNNKVGGGFLGVLSDYEKLMQYALRILSKKRYTSAQIDQKLVKIASKNAIAGHHVEEVLERLIELRYIDDFAFARDYVAQRIKLRPRGKILIQQELKFKGIGEHLINEVFAETQMDENEMAEDLLRNKMRLWGKHQIVKQKAKAYQYLYSKGFMRDAIYSAMERCYNLGRNGS